jgi:hypothetical protein
MSSISLSPSTGLLHPDSTNPSTALPPKAASSSADAVSAGSGFAEQPGEKSFAAQLDLPAQSRSYFYASIGAIRAGHYTDF